jgi:hypothetical protein
VHEPDHGGGLESALRRPVPPGRTVEVKNAAVSLMRLAALSLLNPPVRAIGNAA